MEERIYIKLAEFQSVKSEVGVKLVACFLLLMRKCRLPRGGSLTPIIEHVILHLLAFWEDSLFILKHDCT